MNDGLLSQEELNALLKEDDSNSSETIEQESAQNDLTAQEKDTLGEISNIAMSGAATTLSILLSNKVTITTPEISVAGLDSIKDDSDSNYLLVEVAYTSGLQGVNVFAIREQDALIIADLMKGGNGENPSSELNEIAMSSISEAMSQMIGASATSMSNMFNKKVEIAPPKVSMVDFSDSDALSKIASETQDPAVKISFKMEIGSLVDSKIMQIMSLDVAKELAASLNTKSAPVQEASASTNIPSVNANDMPAAVSFTEPQYTVPKPVGNASNSNFQQVQFSALNQQENPPLEGNIGLLMDVPLQVKVELGRTKKLIRDILDLGPGSVVELDKLAGEPVDVLVNTKLIAKGEVVVIDENFGVRITEIVSPFDRVNHLQ